ncbi:putative protein phosphatase 2C 24 [Nicotiana tabacum]|uniref:protein-serine/threonine phosphatase n=2 Tax=Nicotiana TaxID=4085 RepID=A0A1S4BGG5_TOBAC|nr:PREDICTED: probable protein phosphatase 2C 24 isoform X1 [Nicotiana sylvestris]XP_016487956.1 PREDICTED: probable protein phosphatase 2C 24 isoform X1 [Nicotiana tabacum]
MAEVCSGVVTETEASPPCESRSQTASRRRMELRKVKFIAGVTPPETENEIIKRPKLKLYSTSVSRFCDNAVHNSSTDDEDQVKLGAPPTIVLAPILSPLNNLTLLVQSVVSPKFGFTSVCGRRRDMEDAVAIHPSFCQMKQENSGELHYFAVYDGHGCSHVATKCEERLHELVKEELENNEGNDQWELAMDRSFDRMDKEVIAWNKSMIRATCRCELQTPECDAVGSTAVVAVVTADKIIVANCGDSRAILCRNGKAIPLSNDQKPDRPDELNRIQEAGGRVIYWDGPRVSGVLAMSRAIGDNYLKPYVICEPEVTITDRTVEDDCLILASDGLWDVVSNDTACGVAGMCLNKGKAPVSSAAASMPENVAGGENPDQGCADASMLLTKLALARRSSDNVSVVVVDLRRNS